MNLKVIPFEQPAGSFFLSVMKADDVIRISDASPRYFDPLTMKSGGGIQRFVSKRRVDEIAEYARTVDATFPTPILLALRESCYSMRDDGSIDVDEGSCISDIVDGQHRVRGLDQSGLAKDFMVPVVFILEPTEEQKALMFATINGKQTKVPASLIYDLFGVSETRSPQKTAHEVARALNSTPERAWYRRLKMLGTKTPGSMESLSQGTFVKQLLPLISKNPVDDMNLIKQGHTPRRYPECIFNTYFVDNKDATILKILMNLFEGVKMTWPTEWDNPAAYILSKSVGFTGIMSALPTVYRQGLDRVDLSADYFSRVFLKAKGLMEARGQRLTSEFFSASASGAARLRDLFHEAVAQL